MTEDEVLQILKFIEESSFDFMELQVGDLKLTVNKAAHGSDSGDKPVLSVTAEPPISSSRAPQVKEAEDEQSQAKPTDAAISEGTVAIKAPMVGTFYAAPEPGAPPFVEVGGHVDEDATVGLIEVMKVFSAVRSGVRGLIAEVCVQNGQFVEYGQTLFLVTPERVSEAESPSG